MDYSVLISVSLSFAGSIMSVVAMVEVLLLIARKLFRLQDSITIDRIELLNKLILFASSVIAIIYLVEIFKAWRSGFLYEQYAFYDRVLGKYMWFYIFLFVVNIIPQLYWFKALRRNLYVTFAIAVLINFGIIWERYIIILTSLSDDYLLTSWSYFYPSLVDISMLAIGAGIFIYLLVLLMRRLRS